MLLIVSVLLTVLCSSCSFLGLHEDLALLARTAEISGKVSVGSTPEVPVFVALYRSGQDKPVLHAYWIASNSGAFRFLVPPGAYSLFAFADGNKDGVLQPDERVGWYGSPSLITVEPGEVSDDITLILQASSDARGTGSPFGTQPIPTMAMKVVTRHLGTIVNLEDPRFGSKYASRGVWEPVKFLEEPGAGIFFLEAFDDRKIPVLFVHGSGGSPRQWSPIIDSLDRENFQPWLVYYPSGLPLGLLGEYLEKYIAELQLQYGFKQLFIVAHSMGGLVARCAINHHLENRQSVYINLLVTLSTPWQGHPAASEGVKYSPLVVPSWYDMVPESQFLQELKNTPLPPTATYALLFGYRGEDEGNGSLSDGVVFLNSVLDNDMLEEASAVYGFDEDHGSTLTSLTVMGRLNQLLHQAAVPHQESDIRVSNKWIH